MSIKKTAKEILNEYADTSDMRTVRTLLASIKNLSSEDIAFRSGDFSFNKTECALFFDMMSRYKANEPISKILNKKAFWKHIFYVDENVLDPRPETELIIESVLKILDRNSSLRFLDVGTGSGCILLSLLLEFKNSCGVGIDISRKAVQVAEKNKKILDVKNAIFTNIDWNDLFENFQEPSFDVLVSNPPYIKSQDILSLDANVMDYDPQIALDGGNDGLTAYREISNIAAKILRNNGLIIFEIGYGQASDISTILLQNAFQVINIVEDLNKIERVIVGKKHV